MTLSKQDSSTLEIYYAQVIQRTLEKVTSNSQVTPKQLLSKDSKRIQKNKKTQGLLY